MSKVLSAGMDVAGLWPKYVTTRRGSFVICIIGILIQPWRMVTQPSTFLSVLSAFGGLYSACTYIIPQMLINFTVFLAPMTGVLVCDYWIIRRRKWKVPDLFKQDGIYWYTTGINWRAIIAFVIGFVPSMRK